MSKFSTFGFFPFCARIVSSFEEGYNGSLPEFYMPLEFTSLEDVMAMFWRVKSWKVNIKRQSIYSPDPPASEDVDILVNYIFGTPVTTEIDLICTQSLSWQGFASVIYPNSTVNYSALVSINSNLFILEDIFYVPFSIEVRAGEHIYSGFNLDDSTEFVTEYSGSGSFFPSSAQFSLFTTTSNILTVVADSATVASASCLITPYEFWPYANDDGSDPTYDTTTGLPL